MRKKIIYGDTLFGEFMKQKMINQSRLCHNTKITRSRMSDLARNPNSRMTIKEAYLICSAMKINLNKFIHQLI